MTVRENALNWALDIAANPKHGYSQQSRWGEDYDCSSLVISAWQQAGIPVKTDGATYTGNMKAVFLRNGFKDVTKTINLSNGDGLLPADVLLNEIHHTAMVAGGGKIVHARGQRYGSSAPGDQGSEIAVTNYYNYPWDCVLRYEGPQSVDKECYTGSCFAVLPELIPGNYGPAVKAVQALLNLKGYKGADGKALDVDGELGDNTKFAIEMLQRDAGLSGIWFGTVSAKTWQLMIK